ncbi:ribulose-bisphosphate carboxylase [Synergistales bacterium]|nr:ribulose-bisphosphate carboxylase [Synergistales bacterium]
MFFEDYDDSRTRSLISGGRFSVVYRIYGDERTAKGMAADICAEQTVEFPLRFLPQGVISQEITGRVESFEMESDGQYLAAVSFADETAAGGLPQFLNVVFGNISIKRGIQVARIIPSEGIYSFLSGPRFGVSGLRESAGVFDRPLLFTALKPMGLSAVNMATLARRFAEGGVDVIKDDHGLTNQAFAPFGERVARCADAVRDVNAKFGRKAIYVPNVTAPTGQIMERAARAKEMGAGGLLVTPGLAGFDAIRALAASDIGLPIFAHPAFIGSYALGREGVACDALFGTLMRLAGADATIFPNYGGRFPLSKTECLAIARAGGEKLGPLKPIFPAPAGGIELRDVGEMAQSYGNDMLVLVGGGLFGVGTDIVSNCRRFLDEVKRIKP